MYCNQCGSENPEDSKFCRQCGVSLEVSVLQSEAHAASQGNSVAAADEAVSVSVAASTQSKSRIPRLMWIVMGIAIVLGVAGGSVLLASRSSDAEREGNQAAVEATTSPATQEAVEVSTGPVVEPDEYANLDILLAVGVYATGTKADIEGHVALVQGECALADAEGVPGLSSAQFKRSWCVLRKGSDGFFEVIDTVEPGSLDESGLLARWPWVSPELANAFITRANLKVQAPLITNESSESPCLIADMQLVNGVYYVTVDYIQLKENLETYWDDVDIVNDNPKLRTFELADDSRITGFASATYLYGDQIYPSMPSDGYEIGLVDFKRLVSTGQANAHDPFWDIKVINGRVVTLAGAYTP